jgi:hypothetical protein
MPPSPHLLALLLPTDLSAQISSLPAMVDSDSARKGLAFPRHWHVAAFGKQE